MKVASVDMSGSLLQHFTLVEQVMFSFCGFGLKGNTMDVFSFMPCITWRSLYNIICNSTLKASQHLRLPAKKKKIYINIHKMKRYKL